MVVHSKICLGSFHSYLVTACQPTHELFISVFVIWKVCLLQFGNVYQSQWWQLNEIKYSLEGLVMCFCLLSIKCIVLALWFSKGTLMVSVVCMKFLAAAAVELCFCSTEINIFHSPEQTTSPQLLCLMVNSFPCILQSELGQWLLYTINFFRHFFTKYTFCGEKGRACCTSRLFLSWRVMPLWWSCKICILVIIWPQSGNVVCKTLVTTSVIPHEA